MRERGREEDGEIKKNIRNEQVRRNLPNNNSKNILIAIIVLIIAIILYKLIMLFKSGADKTDHRFIQKSEINKIKEIILHIPERELFMSILHPKSALYDNITNDEGVKECFNNLLNILKEKKIKVTTVSEALKKNITELTNLAKESLTYDLDKNIQNSEIIDERVKNYVSEEYKTKNIEILTADQLVNVLLTNPTYIIRPVETNNYIEPSLISFKPLGNLMFCRDQQITTSKGVVIGRMQATQRNGELKIMKQVFKNLNINVEQLTEEYNKTAYLEGGDFFAINKDLSLLGVGLRTTIKGAEFLMEKDLLGTRFFGIIYDETDLDIDRSHLDTFFNVLKDKLVILLDFSEVQQNYKKKIERKVYLYDNQATMEIESDNKNVPNKCGNYKLIEIYPKFHNFLEKKGFKIVKFGKKEQEEQIINFLNIGDNTVISNSKELEKKVKNYGIEVIYLDFEPIIKMGGSIRSITQVSRYD